MKLLASDGAVGGKVKCKLCSKEWSRGAPRIRAHCLKISGRGVAPCDAEESNLRLLKHAQALEQGVQAQPWVATAEQEEEEQKEQKEQESSEEGERWSDEASERTQKALDGSARVPPPRRLFPNIQARF